MKDPGTMENDTDKALKSSWVATPSKAALKWGKPMAKEYTNGKKNKLSTMDNGTRVKRTDKEAGQIKLRMSDILASGRTANLMGMATIRAMMAHITKENGSTGFSMGMEHKLNLMGQSILGAFPKARERGWAN